MSTSDSIKLLKVRDTIRAVKLRADLALGIFKYKYDTDHKVFQRFLKQTNIDGGGDQSGLNKNLAIPSAPTTADSQEKDDNQQN